jgi:hypothetical protein
MVDKLPHRKLQIKQHELHWKQNFKQIWFSRRVSNSCSSWRHTCNILILIFVLIPVETYFETPISWQKLLNQGFLLVKLKSTWLGWPLWNICVTNDHVYVPPVVNTSRYFPHSRLIIGFVTRLTRRVPLVEHELLTLPEHLRSPPVFSGVRVARSLALYVCFVDRCFSFCAFSFGHCVVCSSIYEFWLPLLVSLNSSHIAKHLKC